MIIEGFSLYPQDCGYHCW